jgi:hypothetical protein
MNVKRPATINRKFQKHKTFYDFKIIIIIIIINKIIVIQNPP